MSRKILALGSVASLVLATGCTGDSTGDAGELRSVTAGAIPIVDVAPLHLGQELGHFEDRGIDLEIEPGSGGVDAITGVASGNFEFAFGNVVSQINMRSNFEQGEGAPLRVIANGNATNGEQGEDFSAVVVAEDSAIETPADLEGATVAANNLENIGDTTVRESVRADGGDPAAVDFVRMDLPDMSAAVTNEEVDAAWVVEPFVTMALQDGHREIASNFADGHPELTVATYFTSEQMLNQEPELIDDIAAALEESLSYAEDNPEEVRRILDSYTEIDEDLTEEIRLPDFPAEVNRESVDTMADLMVEDGLLDDKPDMDELYR